MCFIEKMNCIWIRKREDRVLDPVRTLGQVRYEGTGPSNRGLGTWGMMSLISFHGM